MFVSQHQLLARSQPKILRSRHPQRALLDRASNHVPSTRQNTSACHLVSTPARLSPPPNPHSARGTAAAHVRDFVPWRFSDADRLGAWMVPSSRRPKTCTGTDIGLFRARVKIGRRPQSSVRGTLLERMVLKFGCHLARPPRKALCLALLNKDLRSRRTKVPLLCLRELEERVNDDRFG
jgi:hypothetical protein